MNNKIIIPEDAYDIEVFCIRNGEAFIGFKISNGDFHYVQVPYTEKLGDKK